MGLFCHFLGSLGLFLGLRSGSKTILEPIIVDYQFLFWNYSPIFLFLIGPNFGSFCTFWALRDVFFCPVEVIFGDEVRFKNIFGTYYCRLSIFLLEVQHYLFVFHSSKSWAFLQFLGSLGLFWGLESGPKTFLGPAYID